MPINKEKLRIYRTFKANPELAMFKGLEGFIDKAETELESLKGEIKAEVEAQLRQEMTGLRSYLATEAQKAVQEGIWDRVGAIKGEKGDKGEMGDKGETIVGPIGLTGLRGEKGELGLQGEQGLKGREGKVGKDGKDGKTPRKGIDYFAQKETQEMTDKIQKPIEDKILKKLDAFQAILDKWEKAMRFGGKTLHRGGASYVMNELLGTGDGTTTTFDLDNVPYSTAELQITVGGGMMFLSADGLTDDFTISGKTITFLTAPPDGAKVRSPIYRKS